MSESKPARYAALHCPDHGLVYIGFAEYVKQLYMPNRKWSCPSCGCVATFDDEYFEQQHPTDTLQLPQERSKLEQSYNHEQVKLLVFAATQYTDDVENAIQLLGKQGSLAASAKAKASRMYYLEALKPFQHLRHSNEN
jgi:hypothetical protein